MRYLSGYTYQMEYPNPAGYVLLTIYSDKDIARVLEDRASEKQRTKWATPATK